MHLPTIQCDRAALRLKIGCVLKTERENGGFFSRRIYWFLFALVSATTTTKLQRSRTLFLTVTPYIYSRSSRIVRPSHQVSSRDYLEPATVPSPILSLWPHRLLYLSHSPSPSPYIFSVPLLTVLIDITINLNRWCIQS